MLESIRETLTNSLKMWEEDIILVNLTPLKQIASQLDTKDASNALVQLLLKNFQNEQNSKELELFNQA